MIRELPKRAGIVIMRDKNGDFLSPTPFHVTEKGGKDVVVTEKGNSDIDIEEETMNGLCKAFSGAYQRYLKAMEDAQKRKTHIQEDKPHE